MQAEDDGRPLKTPIKNIYANDNIDMEMAPSVAEADEILAQFGYVEEEALLLAALFCPVLLWMLVKELGRR